MPRLGDVIAALDEAYPPELAESWDAVGLVCGDPEQPVERVLVAVDPSPAVVDEAVRLGADLLLVHHPLLLRPVTSIAASGPKGASLHRLIAQGCALFTAHTNADSARGGVNDALCDALGIAVQRPLEPRLPAHEPEPGRGERMVKLTVFAPAGDVDALIDALAAVGAGDLGDYDRCAYLVEGRGTFRPGPGAAPSVGTIGQIEHVAEARIEMILPGSRVPAAAAAIRQVHSYEEPAFDFVELLPMPSAASARPAAEAAEDVTDAIDASGVGIGRVGVLAESVSLAEFAEAVAAALPATRGGVRVAGDPTSPVRTVAVCSGAGDSLLGAAKAAGVDAYVTADLRHHTASEHLDAGGPALVEVSHWASEWPWCPVAADVLRSAFGDSIQVEVSTLRTDPWEAHLDSPQVQD